VLERADVLDGPDELAEPDDVDQGTMTDRDVPGPGGGVAVVAEIHQRHPAVGAVEIVRQIGVVQVVRMDRLDAVHPAVTGGKGLSSWVMGRMAPSRARPSSAAVHVSPSVGVGGAEVEGTSPPLPLPRRQPPRGIAPFRIAWRSSRTPPSTPPRSGAAASSRW